MQSPLPEQPCPSTQPGSPGQSQNPPPVLHMGMLGSQSASAPQRWHVPFTHSASATQSAFVVQLKRHWEPVQV